MCRHAYPRHHRFPEEAQKEFEKIVGKRKLLENLGMTETSPLIASNPVKGRKKLGSVGLPLINTDIRLLDPVSGEEVPLGVPGEICVKGPQVMVGLLWQTGRNAASHR